MTRYATLARSIEVFGIGLHTSHAVRVTLCPSEIAGLHFARVDLPGAPLVAADWRHVTSTTHATTLQNGAASAMTTEHLLAALWASGITHCRIELDAPEVPILDGSSRSWCAAITEAGTRELPGERPLLELSQPVWIQQGQAHVLGVPAPEFRVSVAVDFDVAAAPARVFDGTVTPANFAREIADARTFTLQSWLEPLQNAGLIKGGSLDNAIVIDDNATDENGWSSPPRFANEMARHKALDVIGDLALLFGTANFRGHLIATRAGHGPHREWMQQCRKQGALRLVDTK